MTKTVVPYKGYNIEYYIDSFVDVYCPAGNFVEQLNCSYHLNGKGAIEKAKIAIDKLVKEEASHND